MRVGYFADGPWSHQALELIVRSNELSIAFIVPRFETQDLVLKEWAERLSVPFLPCKDVNSEEFINLLSQYPADIFVSMSFNQILKPAIIGFPPKGFINCHAGALPFYRGRNPLNWVLINDEKSFGITVHFIDEGIDTGDIIEQRLFPISDEDTYKTLLSRAIEGCGRLLFESLIHIKSGTATRQNQKDIHPVGTYFGMRKYGDEIIDFSWSARRCFNFIRAISEPGPGARCYIKNTEYIIHEATEIENAPNYLATVGEVVGRDDDGIIVKVGDSSLKVTCMSVAGDGDDTSKFIPSFRIGIRFT